MTDQAIVIDLPLVRHESPQPRVQLEERQSPWILLIQGLDEQKMMIAIL